MGPITQTATGHSGPVLGLVGAAAVALAAVHVLAPRLRFVDVAPRSRLLSLAGGASVAYVFVHLLPELEGHRAVVEENTVVLATTFERHVHLVALIGFVVYYGLERYVKCRSATDVESPTGVFWLHVGSFAAYNALVGYLLVHREAPGVESLLAFAVAMALHFLVNDFGLRQHHREEYARGGRWVLAAAVLGGTIVGLAVEVSETVLAMLFAFLAGGIVLNTIKEELPEERDSRFWAFALGAGGYAAVLLVA